jgi:hypothetical protein
MKRKDIERAMELCVELPRIRDELLRLGLFKTHHAMDAAVKAIGYEVAENVEAQP